MGTLIAPQDNFRAFKPAMPVDCRCWVIKRNCSSTPRQLAFVFGSIIALSMAFGIAFAVLGLWLVLPFAGLELAAVAAAFFVYARHAADYERIQVRGPALEIEQVRGLRRQTWSLPVAWTRVEPETARGLAMHATRCVIVASGATRIEVGNDLTAAHRVVFARELRHALSAAMCAA